MWDVVCEPAHGPTKVVDGYKDYLNARIVARALNMTYPDLTHRVRRRETPETLTTEGNQCSF